MLNNNYLNKLINNMAAIIACNNNGSQPIIIKSIERNCNNVSGGDPAMKKLNEWLDNAACAGCWRNGEMQQ